MILRADMPFSRSSSMRSVCSSRSYFLFVISICACVLLGGLPSNVQGQRQIVIRQVKEIYRASSTRIANSLRSAFAQTGPFSRKWVSTEEDFVSELRKRDEPYRAKYTIDRSLTDNFQRKNVYQINLAEPNAVASSMTFRPQRKYLVFAMAGDNHVIDMWFPNHAEDRNYDVIIGYYGNKELQTKHEVDLSFKLKGYKIQALRHLHERLFPGVLSSYNAVFAMDCDIKVNPEQLNELFVVRELYGLDLLGPTQSPKGKVSYAFMKPMAPQRRVRYIPFAETNTPLFSCEFLRHLFAILPKKYELYDWGYDVAWGSIIANEGRHSGVTDWITVENPIQRKGHSEIGDDAHQQINREKWEAFYKATEGEGELRKFGMRKFARDLTPSRGFRYIDLDYPSGLPKTVTPETPLIRYVDDRDYLNLAAVGDKPGYPYYREMRT